MKIWFINHYAVTPEMPGGTRQYEMALELTKKGHRVTIFASSFSYISKQYICSTSFLGCRKEIKEAVEIFWQYTLPYQKNDWHRMLAMLSFTISTFICGFFMEKPQVIIGSSPHLLTPLAAYFLARIKGARFVLEVADLWPEVIIRMRKTNKVVIWWLKLLEKFLYKKAKKVVVLSKNIYHNLVAQRIDKDKLKLIPNGIYLRNVWFSPREETRRELDWENYFVVIYAGAHGQANSLNTALAAARVLQKRKDVLFVFIGDGVMKPKLMEEAEFHNLQNVCFMDPVAKNMVYTFLAAADVGIALVTPDCLAGVGSPNKVFDYMAVKLPVIHTIDGDTKELVEKAQAGAFVRPGDPQALAEAIINLKNNPQICRQYGENGRRFIETFCSREKLTEELEKILKAL